MSTTATAATTAQVQIQAASYAKLKSGDWGLRIHTQALVCVSEGDAVEITTKDGQKRIEKIGKIYFVVENADKSSVIIASKFATKSTTAQPLAQPQARAEVVKIAEVKAAAQAVGDTSYQDILADL